MIGGCLECFGVKTRKMIEQKFTYYSLSLFFLLFLPFLFCSLIKTKCFCFYIVRWVPSGLSSFWFHWIYKSSRKSPLRLDPGL
ncbi:hypothetical protein BDV25DRAFT_156061 [Aspergillus avenaceus]|uniref:Uncharacterized protein n=1 Tax=Aspergillus avenaceus TaxID=36643 RepID=A0A5N6TTI6_ASPAV|nr:hypothetical protein BDV25DRAFT_156061 [Aspergillus avenaceus]